MREPEEEPLFLTNRLVKAVAFRVESIGARVTADEIKAPLWVTRLVGQGIELQVGLGNRTDQFGRNNIILERVALDARSNLPGSEWVIDLEARTDREQRR